MSIVCYFNDPLSINYPLSKKKFINHYSWAINNGRPSLGGTDCVKSTDISCSMKNNKNTQNQKFVLFGKDFSDSKIYSGAELRP